MAWPRVETEPRSGRKILSVGIHACEMEGLTTVEARMLLMDLLEHAIHASSSTSTTGRWATW